MVSKRKHSKDAEEEDVRSPKKSKGMREPTYNFPRAEKRPKSLFERDLNKQTYRQSSSGECNNERRLILRWVIVLNSFYSEKVFIPKINIPNSHCFELPLLWKIFISKRSLFWKIITPKGHYSERLLFWKVVISKTVFFFFFNIPNFRIITFWNNACLETKRNCWINEVFE